MEWNEALPLLRENHTGVAVTITPGGRAQATVVSTAVLDGKIGFASRANAVKLKNIRRTGRATVTVIKFENRRYVTVEGPATIEPWQDTPEHIERLKELYTAMGRAPKEEEEFARRMREEERSLVLVTPQRLYGSLRQGA